MKKLTLLVVAGAGYVLGSRAGRERYEQIKSQATKTWNSPTVQDAADAVQAQAKQAAGDVKDKVVDKVSSNDTSHEQPSTIAPGQGTS
ncbi:hypothetical protein [Aeromicrobium endophyticum]|uniref:YtxH domain-containing protein n=1 Tax=Aeromicrobium endophyticum TaxID=2292704 RepID=A0A371PB14_9ACTN|nr:hypothetical protein [Aeromicrobium endophyticum]REK73119.1 hypothetical protein DX116_05945 [Aeromicrobium endophyticum]